MYKNTKKMIERNTYLPGGEILFTQYFGVMGAARSTNKLARYCVTQGWINPKTRKPPTRMALWFAMWRWAILPENQKKAYELYNSSLKDDGKFLSLADWKALLIERAQVCLDEKYFNEWKVKNGIA